MNHLDGVQAVAYGRLRLMDSDYARTERQRLVIQKAFEKAKKADFADIKQPDRQYVRDVRDKYQYE